MKYFVCDIIEQLSRKRPSKITACRKEFFIYIYDEKRQHEQNYQTRTIVIR